MAVGALAARGFVVLFLPQTGSQFSVLFHLPLLFFSFEVDFLVYFGPCFHESSSMSQPHTLLVRRGGPFGVKDSASSLREQVRE